MSKSGPVADEAKFDVRLLEHRIRRGDVSPEEYEKFLKSLPDDADLAEEAKVTFTSPFADAHFRK